jgi:hypothetical protein
MVEESCGNVAPTRATLAESFAIVPRFQASEASPRPVERSFRRDVLESALIEAHPAQIALLLGQTPALQ